MKALLTNPGWRALRYMLATLLGAACGAVLAIGGSQPASFATAMPVVNGHNGHHAAFEADALLFRTLNEIGNNRLDAALAEIDKIIQAYPKFRLAHLIKGDLLLARTRPISTIGNTNHVP